MARLEVRKLRISDRVAEKLVVKHGLDPDAVRQAVEGCRLPFRWDHHLTRGTRALVLTSIGDEPCVVVLYPARTGDAGEWHLGSAYPIEHSP